MGRDEREGAGGPEALHREADGAPAVDHAGGSGSVAAAYLEDASGFRGFAERVFVPSGEEGVAEVLRRASEEKVPVTIAGAGTGVTGGRVAQGGWVLSLERLTRLEISRGRATVGAGVPLSELHAAAARSGQLYAPDPTETAAFLGGTIATNASGARSFRYGDTRRHVLGLRIALAGGRVVGFRRGEAVDFAVPAVPRPRTTKHTAGYSLHPGMDWVDLFIGSEGTLGAITEAEVRLVPRAAAVLAGVVFFLADDAALDAVEQWRPIAGLRMLEYFDRPSLDLLRARFPEIPPGAGAAILFEQELASEDSPEIDLWTERLKPAGAPGEASWFGLSAPERERFRRFRHALPELINDTVRRNGCLKIGSDYAVPLERNREMLAYYRRRLEATFPGRYAIFGHIGDAHVHVNILPASAGESARAAELMLEFAHKAVELGGTISAEHGLGRRKAHLLEVQYAPIHLEAMKQVKRRLDPDWLLGRGVLWKPEC